jgi:CRP-like cAMP-binding protein
VIDEAFARAALQQCALFRHVDVAGLDACLACLRLRRYRKDETVFHQGDPGDALYVVASGLVKVVLPSPDTGEPAILATLRPGQFFGELAMLDGEPHSASVVALEPTEALVLGRDDFERLFEAEPSIRRSLVLALTGELRRLTDHVEALHFLDLPGRLAFRIADLARAAAVADAPTNGTTSSNGTTASTGTLSRGSAEGTYATAEVRLDWPYTQAELAGMVGGSRESVNRMLADFVARGLIRFEQDTLVVPDPARLTREARR